MWKVAQSPSTGTVTRCRRHQNDGTYISRANNGVDCLAQERAQEMAQRLSIPQISSTFPCKVSSQKPSSHIRCSFLPSLPFPPRSHHLPLSPNPAVPSDQGVCLFTCLFQSTLSLLHISLRSPRLFYENLMMLWEF